MEVIYYLRTLILLIFIVWAAKTNGSNPKNVLTGKIIDFKANINIEYASVALYAQNDSTLVTGAISNVNGIFVINSVAPGNYNFFSSFCAAA